MCTYKIKCCPHQVYLLPFSLYTAFLITSNHEQKTCTEKWRLRRFKLQNSNPERV